MSVCGLLRNKLFFFLVYCVSTKKKKNLLQVYRSDDAENIGYVIPTTVVSHFLDDYKKNGKYSG